MQIDCPVRSAVPLYYHSGSTFNRCVRFIAYDKEN